MSRKILFVDDDQVLQRVMQNQLAEVGSTYTLTFANDGFDAIKKLEKVYYSLVVVDMVMPRMDGLSLFVRINQKYPDVAVILIDEKSDEQMRQLIESTEAIALLEKPYLAADLSELILSYLHREAEGGVMYNVSPPVFLQLMEMEAKTCTIRLLDYVSGQGGVLYFKEGELLDARIGEFTGLEACYCLFAWDSVTVLIRNDCPLNENVINSDLQAIILKAVALKDESDALSMGGDGLSSVVVKMEELLRKEKEDGISLELLSTDAKMKNVVTKAMAISEDSGLGKLESAVVQGRVSTSLSYKITQLLCDSF